MLRKLKELCLPVGVLAGLVIGWISICLVMTAPDVQAAGSLTVPTVTYVGAGVRRWQSTWTSTAGGAVSGNTLGIPSGDVFQIEFVPGTGGTQPTDLYDVQLNTGVGTVNLLGTSGDNLSQTTSKIVQLVPPYFHDGMAELDLVIANAGASKTGTVIVWVRQ